MNQASGMKTRTANELPSLEPEPVVRPIRILLIEDNPGNVVLIKSFLSSPTDFCMRSVSTVKETYAACREETYDVILLDTGLPDSSGVETLKKIRLFNSESAVVVLTCLDDEGSTKESLREGAQDYLVKNNLNGDKLVRSIRYGIERKKVHDLLKNNARQLSLLSSACSSINNCEDTRAIFKTACFYMGQLLNMAGIVTFKVDKLPKLFTSKTEYLNKRISEIEEMTGVNLAGLTIQKDCRKINLNRNFQDGKIHMINANAENSGSSSGERIRLKNPPEPEPFLYFIGFVRERSIYGGSIILSYNRL